jgi:signal transduction histidine kinase
MSVPLIAKGKSIGLLTLSHTRPGFYTGVRVDLVTTFAQQAAVAIENARLYEQARDLAAIEERQRLARELHDSVSQALYGIALGARTARTLLARDPERVAEPLNYITSLAEAGLAEMRSLILELQPESLKQEGLVNALIKQADALRARHQIAVTADLCPEPDVPLDVKQALYRVTQEALHNIVKHARAERVEIRLMEALGGLQLTVTDDGQGFDVGLDYPGHFGLVSMRERLEKLDGELHVSSVIGSGTTITARIQPKNPGK